MDGIDTNIKKWGRLVHKGDIRKIKTSGVIGDDWRSSPCYWTAGMCYIDYYAKEVYPKCF